MQKILFAFPKKLLAVQCQEVEKRIWGLYFFFIGIAINLVTFFYFQVPFQYKESLRSGVYFFSSKKLVIKVLEKSFIGLQI